VSDPLCVVADAGPLLALAKIGSLALLFQLYGSVLTTPAVYEETVEVGLALEAPDARLLSAAFDKQQLKVRAPDLMDLPVPALLHRGEAESLRLAIELDVTWLLVDDRVARHAAEENFSAAEVSTKVKGTLRVIVSAYKDHLLSQQEAIFSIEALKLRPDVWIDAGLCDQVIASLKASITSA
jgi:predicted nucleic acid-binding protein